MAITGTVSFDQAEFSGCTVDFSEVSDCAAPTTSVPWVWLSSRPSQP